MNYQELKNPEVAFRKAFKTFDTNGDGKISAEELKTILGQNKAFANKDSVFWEEMIKDADTDGDGEVNAIKKANFCR